MNLKGVVAWTLAISFIACLVGVIGLFVLLAVGSSVQARYQDVSHEAEHAGWIGQQCVVVNRLVAKGFTAPGGRRGETDGVSLSGFPGGGGPEYTFTSNVVKGTTLRLTSVRKCWNCPFDRISYGFKIDSIPQLAAYEAFAFPDVLSQLSCAKPN